jgi:hypothetical protein
MARIHWPPYVAILAVEQLQSASLAAGTDKLSRADVSGEISTVRKSRKK